MRLREIATGLAMLALASCAGNNEDGPSSGDIAVNIAIGQAFGLANDLIRYEGGLPMDASEVVVAVREYGEGVCDVVLDGADPLTLTGPRDRLDAVYATFTSNDLLLFILVSRAVDTTRQITDLALLPDADPEKFRAPCQRLRTLPQILPRPVEGVA